MTELPATPDSREALKDLQNRLDERLQAAQSRQVQRSWLAVEAAGTGLLLPLEQAGEIFPMAPVLAVPHARDWFCGVVNLRGGLHGVVDIGAFLGLRQGCAAQSAAGREGGRLLALNPDLRTLCALRIDRLAGLRRPEELTPMPVAELRPAFAGGLWRDRQGRHWQELDLAALAVHESFLSIALPKEA
jgi:twitching motility protein PilI